MANKKKPKAIRTWAPDRQIKPKGPDELCDKFEIVVDPNAAPVDGDALVESQISGKPRRPAYNDRTRPG